MFDTIDPDEPIELPVTPIAEPTKDDLQRHPPLKREDYKGFKEDFLRWLIREGKSPSKGDGYSEDTVRATHYRIEHCYRWKWEQDGDVTTEFTPEDADELIELLNTRTTKPESEVAKFQKSLKRLFKYFNQTKGTSYEWDPDYLDDKNTGSQSHNYFKKYELGRLYQAAVELSSFKSYNTKMSAEERNRLKIHLAQRFEKPKDEIGPDDFEKANSWKIPSLVAVCCDAGLRPIEVERATVQWVNLRDGELVIPKEDSSKGDEMWEIALSGQSTRALRNWLNERDALEKYDERDEIWLTKYGNPYTTQSLNGLLQDKLIPTANIEERNRNLTWYSIRRGVATLWANEEGIHNAKEQLRHKKIETTERYVNSSAKERSKMADSKW